MAKKRLPNNVRERDGKYYYRFSIKDGATGKRKQKETRGFATPREAEREAIRIQSELLQGTYVDKNHLNVSSWCEDWLQWYESTGRVKESTIDQRRSMLDMLSSQIGGLKLQEVTDDIYQQTLLTLSKSHSVNTLRSVHSTSRMLFKRAVQKDKIKSDPTQHAYIPRKKLNFEEHEQAKQLPRYLEKSELLLFLASVKSEQFKRLFALLAYTGMRSGELSALFVTDAQDDVLTISKTRYSKESITKYKLTTPKNASSDRRIYLSQKAIDVVKEQLTWRREFAFSKGKRFYNERQFLFVCETSRAGYPIYQALVADHMRYALEKAGLPLSLTPHSLRHTYTSLMAEAGADLDTIQAQLGHSRGSDVTRGIYLHVTKAREKRDVARLDALLDAVD